MMVKKVLNKPVGWVDHVAGAAGGAALGLGLAGTGIFLLTGADLDTTRDGLDFGPALVFRGREWRRRRRLH